MFAVLYAFHPDNRKNHVRFSDVELQRYSTRSHALIDCLSTLSDVAGRLSPSGSVWIVPGTEEEI